MSEEFENPIRAYLKRHNLSQVWLANILKASQGRVSNWCRDKNGPSMEHKVRLVELSNGEITFEALERWALAISVPRRARAAQRADRLATAV